MLRLTRFSREFSGEPGHRKCCLPSPARRSGPGSQAPGEHRQATWVAPPPPPLSPGPGLSENRGHPRCRRLCARLVSAERPEAWGPTLRGPSPEGVCPERASGQSCPERPLPPARGPASPGEKAPPRGHQAVTWAPWSRRARLAVCVPMRMRTPPPTPRELPAAAFRAAVAVPQGGAARVLFRRLRGRGAGRLADRPGPESHACHGTHTSPSNLYKGNPMDHEQPTEGAGVSGCGMSCPLFCTGAQLGDGTCPQAPGVPSASL